jgi:hypothetical protein
LLKANKNLDFALVDFELIENRKTESVYIQLNERAKEFGINTLGYVQKRIKTMGTGSRI